MVTKAPIDKYDLHTNTLRDIIKTRMRELGVTTYALAFSGHLKMSPATVYRYLSGETDSMGENVQDIMRACGLKVISERRVPTWARDSINGRRRG